MATVNNFEDLEIWQMAREICRKIHEYTQRENFRRDFSLVDQMKRSSGSIMDNIAEGFEREGTKEFIQYLYISKGSSGECRSQTYHALDRKYINEELKSAPTATPVIPVKEVLRKFLLVFICLKFFNYLKIN